MPHAAAFIRDKEEGAVLYDWSAERPAKLVLIELWVDGIEVALRVENLVSEIFVDVAVPVIRSGLGDHVDDCAGVASVLRVERIADDAKFFDRVRSRLNRRQVHELIVRVAAVHAEVVGAIAAAVHRNRTGAIAAVERPATGTQLRLDTGLQLQELVGIARIQRKFIHRAIVDDGAQAECCWYRRAELPT